LVPPPLRPHGEPPTSTPPPSIPPSPHTPLPPTLPPPLSPSSPHPLPHCPPKACPCPSFPRFLTRSLSSPFVTPHPGTASLLSQLLPGSPLPSALSGCFSLFPSPSSFSPPFISPPTPSPCFALRPTLSPTPLSLYHGIFRRAHFPLPTPASIPAPPSPAPASLLFPTTPVPLIFGFGLRGLAAPTPLPSLFPCSPSLPPISFLSHFHPRIPSRASLLPPSQLPFYPPFSSPFLDYPAILLCCSWGPSPSRLPRSLPPTAPLLGLPRTVVCCGCSLRIPALF